MATDVQTRQRKKLGFGTDSTITSSSALPSLPAETSGVVALIQAEGSDLHWTDDGSVTPTDAVGGGMLLAAGNSFLYDFGDVSAVKVIGAGTVNVHYYV